ncbi:hypothetical protein CANINC_003991 [Pichia inconspicua]|uniref:Uncharacterized protein n=1 Tax=Pichia inconspicua TaxID=52247 RepID=A0A4T0WXF4_9ASCO|nr:hypothetical protein CANINC_003991 [[Candida] inconspicua]
MLSRISLRAANAYSRTYYSTRFFSSTFSRLAKEDPDAARNARLQAFLNQIRSTPAVFNQLKAVQLIIASKIDASPDRPPSIMQQLSLLTDPEVRAEMVKLSEAMAAANINIDKEDVGFLMQSLKAHVDENKD